MNRISVMMMGEKPDVNDDIPDKNRQSTSSASLEPEAGDENMPLDDDSDYSGDNAVGNAEDDISVLQPFAAPIRSGQKFSGLWLDRIVWGFSLILVLAVLVMAGIFFTGFAENDTGLAHLISALALTLGLAALAWLPLWVTSRLVWRAAKHNIGPTRLSAVLVIVMFLPWLIFGVLLLPLGGLALMAGTLTLISVLILTVWTLWRSGLKSGAKTLPNTVSSHNRTKK